MSYRDREEDGERRYRRAESVWKGYNEKGSQARGPIRDERSQSAFEDALDKLLANHEKSFEPRQGERLLSKQEIRTLARNTRNATNIGVIYREARQCGYFNTVVKRRNSNPSPRRDDRQRPRTATPGREPIQQARASVPIQSPRRNENPRSQNATPAPNRQARVSLAPAGNALNARPDDAVTSHARAAAQRRVAQEQTERQTKLEEAKEKFIAEAIEIHDDVPMFTTRFCKPDTFDADKFGTEAQPARFEQGTITSALRFLKDWEDELSVKLQKNYDIIDGWIRHPKLVQLQQETAIAIEKQRNLTANASQLLEDIQEWQKAIDDGEAELAKLEVNKHNKPGRQ